MDRTRFASLEEASVERAARRNHYEEEATGPSFWRNAAASLPPHARRKYGHLFMAAERYEPIVEFLAGVVRRRRSNRTAVKGRGHREAHA